MKKRITFIGLAVVGLAVGAVLLLRQRVTMHTLEIRLTPEQAAAQADLIVTGALGAKSQRIDWRVTDGPLLFSDWDFKTRNVLKGTAPADMKITIPGGSTPLLDVSMDESLKIRRGTEAIVYLKYITEVNRWVPLSVSQTIFVATGNGRFANRPGDLVSEADVQTAVVKAKPEQSGDLRNAPD